MNPSVATPDSQGWDVQQKSAETPRRAPRGVALSLILLMVAVAIAIVVVDESPRAQLRGLPSALAPGIYTYTRPDGSIGKTTYIAPGNFFTEISYDGRPEHGLAVILGDHYSLLYLERFIERKVDGAPVDLVAEHLLLDEIFLARLADGSLPTNEFPVEVGPPVSDTDKDTAATGDIYLPVPSSLKVGTGPDAEQWTVLDYQDVASPTPEQLIADLVSQGFELRDYRPPEGF